MTERAVPRPKKSTLVQPPTPIMELDLQDIELCGAGAELTRAIEVPSDVLAEMRAALAETLATPRSEAEIEDRTIAMLTPYDPLAFAATQEMPSVPPIPESIAPLPRKARPVHVFLAVMLGLLVSGGEVFAAKTLPHVVARVAASR